MSLTENIKTGYLKRQAKTAEKRFVQLKRPDQFLKILILVDEKNDHLMSLAALKFKNAEMNQLYVRTGKEDESQEFQYAVHASDFNLTGRLKNDKLKKLLGYEFDLILDLSSNPVYLDYFLRNLKSTLVIGPMSEKLNDRFDLFFEGDQNNEAFLNLIVKQLNQLTSNGSE